MKVALPLFGTRVSPRCRIAREMILATVEDGAVTAREAASLEIAEEDDLVECLAALGVDVLVCGGIRRETEESLLASGIRVLNNVAGEAEEVLGALCGGGLAPGHGLGGGVGAAAAAPEPPLPSVDCLACESRECVSGRACPFDLGPEARPPLRGEEARIREVGLDVSAEIDPKLCRIAELVHFGLGVGYRRIGLAFCWELHREIEVLVPVLRRFFDVVPVCCRIGAASAAGAERSVCHPVAVARLLAAAGTELNVAAGLCLGSDILFASRSRAPVTTLFVKDRSLAHNPVGAIYTRYHLMDLTAERGGPRPARSGRHR